MRYTTTLMLLSLAACGAYGTGDRGSASTWGTYGEALSDIEPPLDEGQDVCDDTDPVVLFASPDDSNSMSSPLQAWEQVAQGQTPWSPIRTWEFFNYATWDYPAAETGQLAVDLQLAEGDAPGTFALQVGISSEAIAPQERPPMVLTFSVDQSGSMSGIPIEMMRESLRIISAQLRSGDIVSIVGWSNDQDVLLEAHTIRQPGDPTFLAAINRISTSGGTDLAGGLKAAYRITEQHHVPGRIHRVVLMSDGGANIGLTDAELIGEKAGDNDADGIYMVGVGTGAPTSYNDYLMNAVTDLGRGAAVFIPNQEVAAEVFGERFLETMMATARDVQIRYDLPPGFSIDRFSGEELSTDPNEVAPQHMAPNDAVVLYQHLSACDEEVDLSQTIAVTVSYFDGVTFEPRTTVVQASLEDLLAGPRDQLLKGAAVYTWAETLKHLQGGDADTVKGEARAALEEALAANPNDEDLQQIAVGLDRLGL